MCEGEELVVENPIHAAASVGEEDSVIGVSSSVVGLNVRWYCLSCLAIMRRSMLRNVEYGRAGGVTLFVPFVRGMCAVLPAAVLVKNQGPW